MRAVLQLCQEATLRIDSARHDGIERGLLVLVGVSTADSEQTAALLADKIAKLRIFPDENDRLNLNLCDPRVAGELLVVSNFTLYADCKKSRRPDFFAAEKGVRAKELFETFLVNLRLKLSDLCRENGWSTPRIATGVFGADMKITFTNDGPVTLVLDTDAL